VAEPGIAFVCPTYGQFGYAIKAIRSFLRYTPNPTAIVVDDASPGWEDPAWRAFLDSILPRRIVHRFPDNGGLTRSWNLGIRRALSSGVDYIIAGNSDILFCRGWYRGLIAALNSGYALAGPVSNAPGPTSLGLADVTRYCREYVVTDECSYLDSLSEALQSRFRGQVAEARINGFFQMARGETWWDGRFDDGHIYRPINIFSGDVPNPTPLMTYNEDELQARWAGKGWKSAVCPSSFIFHYRSATRGEEYLHGLWFRAGDAQSCDKR
jgi:glycosyltransferase involved in cell wall biosynthesis